MTDYTLNVDTSDIAVALTDIHLSSTRVLQIQDLPHVVVSLTPFRDRIHEWFYVMDGNLEAAGIKTTYRMGATISNTIPIPDPVRTPFVAVQCLIFPDDVSADKKFRI